MKNIELSGPLSVKHIKCESLSKGIFYYLLYVWAGCACVYVCCVSLALYAV